MFHILVDLGLLLAFLWRSVGIHAFCCFFSLLNAHKSFLLLYEAMSNS